MTSLVLITNNISWNIKPIQRLKKYDSVSLFKMNIKCRKKKVPQNSFQTQILWQIFYRFTITSLWVNPNRLPIGLSFTSNSEFGNSQRIFPPSTDAQKNQLLPTFCALWLRCRLYVCHNWSWKYKFSSFFFSVATSVTTLNSETCRLWKLRHV